MTGTSTVLARTQALLGNAGKQTEEQTGCPSATSGDSAEEEGFTQLVEKFSTATPENASGEKAASNAFESGENEASKPDKLLASLDAVLQSINGDPSASPEQTAEEAPPLPSWQSPPPVESVSEQTITSAMVENFPHDYDDPQLLTEEVISEESSAVEPEEENAASIIMPVAAEFAGPLPLLSSAAADMAKFFSEPQETSKAEASETGTSDSEELTASSNEEALASTELPDEITELPLGIDDEVLDYYAPPLPTPYRSSWRNGQSEGAHNRNESSVRSSGSAPALTVPAFAPSVSPETIMSEASQQSTGADTEKGTRMGAGAGMPLSSGETKPSEAARELHTLMGDMKVSVARQETHFSPTMPQSPAMQIADRITGEIYGASAPEVTTAASSQRAAHGAEGSSSTVKVLQLRLDPPELGALTVRMSLKQGVLALQVEATRPETAALIERDRDALIGLLRTAGYSVDGLTVQMAPSTNNSALGSNLAAAGQQQQFAGQQAGEGASGQTDQEQHQDEGQLVWGNADENAETHPARDPGGALYL
jgi:hypothetical protein